MPNSPDKDRREAAMHARKDALFTSEEAVAYDRETVARFDKVSQEPAVPDLEDQVIPNVHDAEEDSDLHSMGHAPGV